jgi:hypothetical protein
MWNNFWHHSGTTAEGSVFMVKRVISRNFRYPSAELREKVRVAVKERGFRSEQAFLIAACEHELRQGDSTEATTQFEARVAATLTNLAKQGQGLHTLAQAQVALTDVLLKYVITCVVEPPEDALPAARVRARLRYQKLVRAAAKEISNKNRDTLREMLADE